MLEMKRFGNLKKSNNLKRNSIAEKLNAQTIKIAYCSLFGARGSVVG
jgi:hypothetical protein